MNFPLLRGALAILFFVAPLHAIGADVRAQYAIVQGRVAPSPPTLAVKRGDRVAIDWRSDRAVTIHLHGYDVALALLPGKGGVLRFDAAVLGRFPVSAHGSHHRETPLVFVEVHPE